MKFKSTRGGVSGVGFEEALLSGYPSDGGLYVPENLPVLTREQWSSVAHLSYPQLVLKFLRIFISPEELLDRELEEMMDICYSKFDDPEKVIPTVKLGPLVMAELWHGPTGAFKDLSLTVVTKLVDFFLHKRNKRSTVLVSTSGDTGGAAIHSVIGCSRIKLMVMYPRHMVSRIQELQMTTITDSNVTTFSVDGSSDDSNEVIAAIQADTEFYNRHNVNVFNSFNICRILVQSIHFCYLYLQQCPDVNESVTISVPTGGMGNAASGMLARSMGLPLKLLLAVNENDTVHCTFSSGHYSPASSIQRTVSPSLDTVTIPHYMERVWYYLAGSNSETIKPMMQQFDEKKSCTLPSSMMAEASKCLCTASICQEKVLSTMRDMWKEYQYLICPHTAVGVAAALGCLQIDRLSQGNRSMMVALGTATAHKFPEAINRAGLSLPLFDKFESLKNLPETKRYMEKGQDWPQIMKKAIEMAWK